MENLELASFSEVINDLSERTNRGEITWSKLNPTTFLYRNDTGRVILQELSKNVRAASGGTRIVKTYLFQVLDSSGETQLVVNGADAREANDILLKLYEVITSGLTMKGLDFLKSMVKK